MSRARIPRIPRVAGPSRAVLRPPLQRSKDHHVECPAADRWSLRYWFALPHVKTIYSTRCQIVYYLGWVSSRTGGGPEGPPYAVGLLLRDGVDARCRGQ